jgi:hypothetical protein
MLTQIFLLRSKPARRQAELAMIYSEGKASTTSAVQSYNEPNLHTRAALRLLSNRSMPWISEL